MAALQPKRERSALFDIGWTELVVVAIVAILVVGPKDLPGMLRSTGRMMGNLRRMARDFQKQFDDALRDAELDEVRKLNPNKPFKPLEDARKSMQDYEKQVKDAMKYPADSKPEAGAGDNGKAETAIENAPKAEGGGNVKTDGKPTAEKKAAAKKSPARKSGAAKAPAKRNGKASAASKNNRKRTAKAGATTGTDG